MVDLQPTFYSENYPKHQIGLKRDKIFICRRKKLSFEMNKMKHVDTVTKKKKITNRF
jgi:hypothetical protein